MPHQGLVAQIRQLQLEHSRDQKKSLISRAAQRQLPNLPVRASLLLAPFLLSGVAVGRPDSCLKIRIKKGSGEGAIL